MIYRVRLGPMLCWAGHSQGSLRQRRSTVRSAPVAASRLRKDALVPFIDVTYDNTVTDPVLQHLAELLPNVVAEGVACPEEPWLGSPKAGDIEIRFRAKGPFDLGELNCVVEVRTKLFSGRVQDKQLRAEKMRDDLVSGEPGVGRVGVWLILAEGSWAQT